MLLFFQNNLVICNFACTFGLKFMVILNGIVNEQYSVILCCKLVLSFLVKALLDMGHDMLVCFYRVNGVPWKLKIDNHSAKLGKYLKEKPYVFLCLLIRLKTILLG